jgi:hypothetical protein
MFVHLADDPDTAWKLIGPHALHETNSYGRWLAAAGVSAPYSTFKDADELRESGLYLVLTPDDLIHRLMDLGPGADLVFHPLMGGLDPELAWSSLNLFDKHVLPALISAGYRTKSDPSAN